MYDTRTPPTSRRRSGGPSDPRREFHRPFRIQCPYATDAGRVAAMGLDEAALRGDWGTRIIGQANNVLIFPGVGLGAIVAEARELTDDTFLVAARELAGMVTAERLETRALYPPIRQLRSVARAIAVAVVRHARQSGYGRQYRDEEVEPAVDRAIWEPEYLTLEPA